MPVQWSSNTKESTYCKKKQHTCDIFKTEKVITYKDFIKEVIKKCIL